MTPTGDDTPDAGTVGRMGRNFAEHLTWPHRHTPGMPVVEHGRCVLSDCGLPTDTFNTIYLPGDTGGLAPAGLAAWRR